MKRIAWMAGLAATCLALAGTTPALALTSEGYASTQTYTLDFNTPGLGPGTCTVSYYLGPDLVSAPVVNYGVGLGVESKASASCTGTGAPDDVFADTSGSGPGGTSCSYSNSYIGGYSYGTPSATASCTMTSYNGWYSGHDRIEVDVSGGWTTSLTNSVPGCSYSYPSSAVCNWYPGYSNGEL